MDGHPEIVTVVPPDSQSVASQKALDRFTAAEVHQTGDLRLSLNAFTFFKDNEYFNDIVQGYTLFGTQLNSQLVYYPIKDLRLEAGVFLWKDFGNSQLRQVRPTFRATWTKGNQQFIFGNIRPHLNHNYIEPLLDFEQVILKPLEEGLQYRLNSKRVFLDVWVDWLRQEYPGSNYQEQIAGGLSSSFRLTGDNSPVDISMQLAWWRGCRCGAACYKQCGSMRTVCFSTTTRWAITGCHFKTGMACTSMARSKRGMPTLC
jgi:hypothetical protein